MFYYSLRSVGTPRFIFVACPHVAGLRLGTLGGVVEVRRIHLEEIFWDKLNTTFVESESVPYVASMGRSRRSRETNIASPETDRRYGVPDNVN